MLKRSNSRGGSKFDDTDVERLKKRKTAGETDGVQVLSLCFFVSDDDDSGDDDDDDDEKPSGRTLCVSLLNSDFFAHSVVDVGRAAKWYFSSRK